ncbi:hypothetical protein [Micromonospora sagamiensis]|uniref:hypothetical protein n=1 Tax=Micromonospora sagamiensis TaxID=47875 RepID=UPI001645E5FC|nr:hypothetical protein [Micromonospora sagamiensis]BCL14966.1 hypothetical protein GCM10017556_27050 [Micromonospora sagamiensis]
MVTEIRLKPVDLTLVHRRGWLTLHCDECARPWPCTPFRDALALTTPAERAVAVLRMTEEARLVRTELIRISAPALIGRFLWWLRLNRADARILAGEVWPDDAVPPGA